MRRSPLFLLPLLAASSLLFACGNSKEKPWWEKSDACPDGATIERSGGDVFCAKDGARHGRFESYAGDPAVSLLSGFYKNGKRDGTWTQRTAEGKVLGTFELVEGTGKTTTWRDDGSVDVEAEYDAEVLSGRWARYAAGAETPIVVEEGRYKSGKAIGKWTFRDQAGVVIREADYRDGVIWETRYFENGELARTQLSAAAQEEADKRAAELAKNMNEQARSSGILGILRQQQGGAFASLTGTGNFSSGLDDKDVYGGLLGNEVGEMKGGFGYGLKGTGPGGGGTGWGTIGSGKIGTIGKGGGYGTGSGMRGRSSRPRLRFGRLTATGSLDKNIIRRYVRRKANAFRYCYEKQLLVDPSLKGTVVVQFSIKSTGAVSNAKAAGIGNSKVESCMARQAARIKFPQPKGGGTVAVRLPMIFAPGAVAKPAAEATDKKTPGLKGGGAVKRRDP